MIGLTPRQAELLAILRADRTLTVRQMCVRLGVSSTSVSTVSAMVTSLAERGYISLRHGQHPSYRLNAFHGDQRLRFISVQSLPIAGALPA